jgi:hypothetical protein
MQARSYAVTFALRNGTFVSIPDKIVINYAYPHRISAAPLQIFRCDACTPLTHPLSSCSTFAHDTAVLRLSTLTNDERFVFETFEHARTNKHVPLNERPPVRSLCYR